MFQPRRTLRAIVDDDPTRYVILLAWLGGISEMLASITVKPKDHEFPVAFYLLLAVYWGPLFGFFHVYTGAALTCMTGRWLDGRATFLECRAAMAWANAPMVWALPVSGIGLYVFGIELFRPHGRPGLLAVLIIQLALAVWTLVLQVACTAEVQRFSVARAFAAGVLAWIVFVALLVSAVVAALAATGSL